MASTGENERGIPRAPFVALDDMRPEDIDANVVKYQEAISKYKFMEQSVLKRLTGVQDKMPDIEKTLAMVEHLSSQNDDDGADEDDDADEVQTRFELNETLYVRAKVPRAPKKVCLWLGANVMLEYPIGEALQLLQEKLEAARATARNCEADLEFLREQITTMEVNTARVYNLGVTLRRQGKLNPAKQTSAAA